jgi:serine/threonine protein kinase
LTGEHLVKVMETFIQEEEPMMVMEWLSISLDKIVIGKKKFAIKEVFYEILKGALEFHSNDIIHRDLKPANIMLAPKNTHQQSQPEPADIDTNNYYVKIIDLGMAK